jgi:uncharacterized protein DUF928
MKTSIRFLMVATASALWVTPLYAKEPANKQLVAQADTEKPGEEQAAKLTYNPPLRGAPATRVGGGTRSIGTQTFSLSVLAPNETGFTTREKPTIYWYVSETIHSPVELTLTITEPLRDAATPSLELTLQPPVSRGVHALRLDQHAIVLKPGVEYQWFIAVVNNPAQRSGDVIAGGSIKRVANADEVQDRVKRAPQALRAALYAERGLWYDAIDELSQQISANPEDRRLRQQRAALLEQVGLAEAAAFDRTAGQ